MESKLIEGLYAKKPSDNAPSFVKAKISINQKFIDFYNENKNEKGYLNMDILESKDGTKYYAKQDSYKPKENTDNGKQDEPPF